MSKLDSKNILIDFNGHVYRFLNCKIEPNDGSFYVSLLRNGENSETVTFDSVNRSLVRIEHDEPRRKLVRVSYHSSGTVLYRYTENKPNYFEPISRLTRPNAFVLFSIPEINKLDKADTIQEEDFVIKIDEHEGRIEFTLLLAPWQYVIPEPHIAIRYNGLLSLIIIPAKQSVDIPNELIKHFHTLSPSKGLHDKQAVSNDQALIEYHQKINETSDYIIYSPNNSGIYTLIIPHTMRDTPNLNIEFFDDGNTIELVSARNSVIKFKVKNRHGHVIKEEVPIKSIELSAEL